MDTEDPEVREQALRLKNKCHLITFFITQCEETDPLETDENEWHPDFATCIEAILRINEHGAISEDEIHKMNDLYSKWYKRFQELGLDEEDYSSSLEQEVYALYDELVN